MASTAVGCHIWNLDIAKSYSEATAGDAVSLVLGGVEDLLQYLR